MEYNLGKFRIAVTSDEVPDAIFLVQKHGDNVVEADNAQSGQTQADGIVVRQHGKPGGIYTADCLPLVLVAEEFAVVLHVSRKSLVAGILESAREVFKDEQPVHIFIGPHACSEHLTYEYRGDEIHALAEKFPDAVTTKKDITHVSVEGATLSFLKDWLRELPEIIRDGRCTVEDMQLPSYRRSTPEVREAKSYGQIKTVVYLMGN